MTGEAGGPTMHSMVAQLPALFDQLSSGAGSGIGTDGRASQADRLLETTRRIGDEALGQIGMLTTQQRLHGIQQRRDMLMVQLAMLALMIVLTLVIVFRVLVPLGRLRAAAQAVEQGRLDARSALKGQDEFARFSRAFDRMVESLRQRNQLLLDSHRELERSEAFHVRAASIAGVGSWECDLVTNEVRWSEQTRRIHEVDDGYQPTLESAIAFYPLAARQELRTSMDAAIENHQGWDVELPFVTATGRHRWVRAAGAAEYEAGRPIRIAGAFQDVTDRRATEQALRLATREAKAANAAKSAFLANMSHAIRTPMNAATGLVYLLRRTTLESPQRELVDKLEQSNDALLGVVDNVLDLSRIESGELSLTVASFDLPQLIGEIARHVRAQAERSGVAFTVEQAAGLPTQVDGDRARIRQIVHNLLDNAIRFTESGSIRLQVGHEARGDDAVTVMISVEDTGVGIAPATLERLFMPLGAQDPRALGHPIGTGLGLAMVKTLTELMAGEVEAVSTPGVGSRFSVSLPLTLTRSLSEPPDAQPFSIVVAAASLEARGCAEAAAGALGWHVTTVAAGDDVLDRVRERAAGGQPVGVVLIDEAFAGTPVVSLLDALRRLPGCAAVPVVLHVGEKQPADRRHGDPLVPVQAMLAGRFDAAGLFNAVHAALRHQQADAFRLARVSTLGQAGLVRLAGVHVLVADDSAINREVIQRILASEGAQVTHAVGGEQVIALLNEAPERFDAVLMDVQMPLLDGNMATRRIRGELGLSRLPVIALTAGSLATERRRSLEAGMDDVLTKPIDAVQLIEALQRQLMQLRGAVPEVVAQARSTAPGRHDHGSGAGARRLV